MDVSVCTILAKRTCLMVNKEDGFLFWSILLEGARYLGWRCQYKKRWFGAAHSVECARARLDGSSQFWDDRGWMRMSDLVMPIPMYSTTSISAWLKLSRGTSTWSRPCTCTVCKPYGNPFELWYWGSRERTDSRKATLVDRRWKLAESVWETS